MPTKPRLLVFGSYITALVMEVPRLPQAGETLSDDGHFDATPTTEATAFRLYHRPDPGATQAALRGALPALYLSFCSRKCGVNAARLEHADAFCVSRQGAAASIPRMRELLK